MRPTVVATIVIVTAIIGIVVGTFVGRDTAPITATPSSDRTDAAPSTSARAADPSSPRDDEPSARRMRRERRDADPRASSDASDEREQDRSETADPSAPTSDIDTLTRELAALKRENAELREEHAELLGEPLPPRADVEPRFSGPSLTASVGQAIDQAGVVGKVEHVDCSEYPCITFGRLAGDEEDMEEVERAAALSQYDADVLTLLFWATSVDSSEASGSKETGLFALAFYTQDDRATDGAALDRRIRARTVEYWNTDKPARPPAAALD